MNDQELDELVAAAGTPRRGQVESVLLGGPAVELRELIMTTAPQPTIDLESVQPVLSHGQPVGGPLRDRPGRARRRFMVIAVAAVVASAVTVGVINAPSGRDTSANSAYADEIVAVARVAPRLLVTAAGWSVVRADEFNTDTGEIEFANGDKRLDLFWRPLEYHQTYVEDRSSSADPASSINIAGNQALLFSYRGGDTVTALWPDGEHSVEFRADFMSEGEFRGLAATVEAVDIDTWLEAMPASVVTPTDRDAVIAEMLTGIPVPPGFDQSTLGSDGVSDRYQLGAQVTGAVACGWIAVWIAADARGDLAAKDEATRAMATSRSWPILLEMDQQGDWPAAIWDLADALAHDGIGISGRGDVDIIRSGEYEGLGCPR